VHRKNLPFHFGWVNGNCYYELLTSFGISEVLLPNLAIYVPSRRKSANLVGAFTYEDIKRFLERAFAGKVAVFAVGKPDFSQSECTHKAVPEDSTSKELVDEVLEEARRAEHTSPSQHKKPRGKKGKAKSDL